MSNNIADVIIHIDETLPLDELKALESDIHNLDGVVSACGRDDKVHLITVTYSPEHINSLEILNKVRNEGHHAELVGL